MLTLPVVEVDGRFLPGVLLDEIDRALGLPPKDGERSLSAPALADRTVRVNAAVARFARQLPPAHYDDPTPAADGADGPQLLPDGTPVVFPDGSPYEPHRTSFGLVRHLVGHVVKFQLVVEHPEEDWFSDLGLFMPLGEPAAGTDPSRVACVAAQAAHDIRRWLASHPDERFEHIVDTCNGPRSVIDILRDNTYSLLQHTRQLMEILRDLDIEPDASLGEVDFEGFEMPSSVWG